MRTIRAFSLAVIPLLFAATASAQAPIKVYQIDGAPSGLCADFVSDHTLSHFVVAFRPSVDAPGDRDSLDFRAACEVVLAEPPVIDRVDRIEPEAAVLAFQVVKRRLGVFTTTQANSTEFDIVGPACKTRQAEPRVKAAVRDRLIN